MNATTPHSHEDRPRCAWNRYSSSCSDADEKRGGLPWAKPVPWYYHSREAPALFQQQISIVCLQYPRFSRSLFFSCLIPVSFAIGATLFFVVGNTEVSRPRPSIRVAPESSVLRPESESKGLALDPSRRLLTWLYIGATALGTPALCRSMPLPGRGIFCDRQSLPPSVPSISCPPCLS